VPDTKQPLQSAKVASIVQHASPLEKELPGSTGGQIASAGTQSPVSFAFPSQKYSSESAVAALQLDNPEFVAVYKPMPDFTDLLAQSEELLQLQAFFLLNTDGMVDSVALEQAQWYDARTVRRIEKVLSQWEFPIPRVNAKPVATVYRHTFFFTHR